MENVGGSMCAGSRVVTRIMQPRTTSKRLPGPDYLAPQSTSMQLQIMWVIKTHLYAPSGVRIIYIFAGAERQGDIGRYLQQLGVVDSLLQFDLQRSHTHDLTEDGLWQHIFRLLGQEEWILLASPPCETFSRVSSSTSRSQTFAFVELPAGLSLVKPAARTSGRTG